MTRTVFPSTALAESQAAGAHRPAIVDHTNYFSALVNDDEATERTRAAFQAWLGVGAVVDPGVQTGSEDVGLLATAAGAPCVFWFLGGADPSLFAGLSTAARTWLPPF